MNKQHIVLKNIDKTFHHAHETTTIFNNISYTFEQGTSYAIMGPSGVGKSTLLHMIAGIDTPTTGEIIVNHDPLQGYNFEKRMAITRTSVGIMFQHPSLIAELSVIQNVMLTAIAHNTVNAQSYQQALTLLQHIGLEHKAHSSVNKLSGGQQQRIAILRALFSQPAFLIADEPTGNLDKESAQTIIQLLKHYQKLYNMGLVISTHDQHVAQACDVTLHIDHQQLTSRSL